MSDERADSAALAASVDQPDAFSVVFYQHFDDVFRFLRRRLGAATAEDIAAETFARAFSARARFEPGRAVRPWIYGIAVNLLRNHYREEERLLRAFAATGADPTRAGSESSEESTPFGLSAEVAGALGKLPTIEREALLLYAWGDFEYSEIAIIIGVPVGTVRSRLNRARARVIEAMGAILDQPLLEEAASE